MQPSTCLNENVSTTIDINNTLLDKLLELAHKQNQPVEKLIAEVVRQSIPDNG